MTDSAQSKWTVSTADEGQPPILREVIAERDRYAKVLRRIARVEAPWRGVVADALGCSVDDLDPRKQR